MNIHNKIIEACYYYTLCDNSIIETKKYIKLSQQTLKKYILIGNFLDTILLDYLTIKGKHKLSLYLAEKFANIIPNHDFQYDIYMRMCSDNHINKDKIKYFSNYINCDICCELSCNQERLPCCNHFICLDCLYKHLDVTINDITFIGCKCPFCNTYFTRKYLYRILKLRITDKSISWIRGVHKIYSKRFYYRNLFEKMISIIQGIELIQDKFIDDTMDFNKLIESNEKELYYGVCNSCCPPVENRPPPRNHVIFNDIKVNTIEKQCVNSEGNIVVLKREMFKCESCNVSLSVYKKCPHCGIKTLKPDGCNYVICGDHRWCFICNERLPNDNNGHNVHYWTGPGSSPYSNQCRTSTGSHLPHHTLHWCDCISCKGRGPLCHNLDCYNRCKMNINTFEKYCIDCCRRADTRRGNRSEGVGSRPPTAVGTRL